MKATLKLNELTHSGRLTDLKAPELLMVNGGETGSREDWIRLLTSPNLEVHFWVDEVNKIAKVIIIEDPSRLRFTSILDRNGALFIAES